MSYEWVRRVQPRLGSIGERMIANRWQQPENGIPIEFVRWVDMEMALLETATKEFERTGDERWRFAGKACWQMLNAIMDDVEQRDKDADRN